MSAVCRERANAFTPPIVVDDGRTEVGDITKDNTAIAILAWNVYRQSSGNWKVDGLYNSARGIKRRIWRQRE